VTAILVVILCRHAFPLLFTVINSLKTRTAFASDPLGLTWDITFENYVETFRRMGFSAPFSQQRSHDAGGLLLSTVAALFLAYAVTKLRIPGRNLIFLFIISMLVIPSQIIIYPLYETILDLWLRRHLSGLIFAYAALACRSAPTCWRHISVRFPMSSLKLRDWTERVKSASSFLFCYPFPAPAIAALSILNLFGCGMISCCLWSSWRIGQEDAHGWRGAAFGPIRRLDPAY